MATAVAQRHAELVEALALIAVEGDTVPAHPASRSDAATATIIASSRDLLAFLLGRPLPPRRAPLATPPSQVRLAERSRPLACIGTATRRRHAGRRLWTIAPGPTRSSAEVDRGWFRRVLLGDVDAPF
jgi:hypothetical protein